MTPDQLATPLLECSERVEEVNRHILQNSSTLYNIQKKQICSRLCIPRSEIDEINRDAYLTDRVVRAVMQNTMFDGPLRTLCMPAVSNLPVQVVELREARDAGGSKRISIRINK